MLVGTPDCFESPPPIKNPELKSSHQYSTPQKSWNRKLQTQIKPPSSLSLDTRSTVQYPLSPGFRNGCWLSHFILFIHYTCVMVRWFAPSLSFLWQRGKNQKLHVCGTLIAVLLALIWKREAGYFSLLKYTYQIMSFSSPLPSIHYMSSCGMQWGPPLLPYLPMTMDQCAWTQKLPCQRAVPPSLWRQRQNFIRQGSRFPWSILFKKNRKV